VSFVAITLCVASQRAFIAAVVYFVIDSVLKLLDTSSCFFFPHTCSTSCLSHSSRFNQHRNTRRTAHSEMPLLNEFQKHYNQNVHCTNAKPANTQVRVSFKHFPFSQHIPLRNILMLLSNLEHRLSYVHFCVHLSPPNELHVQPIVTPLTSLT